jgi:hypothetical protein
MGVLGLLNVSEKGELKKLSCCYTDCPYITKRRQRIHKNGFDGCINEAIVDVSYLALCPPVCKLSKEKGLEWERMPHANWRYVMYNK